MIEGLDSSIDRPTPAQAAAARAAGVLLWSGYLALPGGGRGLLSTWSPADFANAAACGAPPLAFCSGWDDPGQLRELAASLGVRLCLDVEPAIRPDGPWVQGWLDAAGAGLYGLAAVHTGRTAAFHVVARYPALLDAEALAESWDPAAGPRPAAPCGWQKVGSHLEFGCQVDRGTYDDWFGGNMDGFNDTDRAVLSRVLTLLVDGVQSTTYDGQTPVPATWPNWLPTTLAALGAPVGVDALAAAIVAKLPPATITKDDVQAACTAAITAAAARLAAG